MANYTVKAGDSLSAIAKRLGIPNWNTLYNQNRNTIGSNPNLIYTGQVLNYGGATPAPVAKPAAKPVAKPAPAKPNPTQQANAAISADPNYQVTHAGLQSALSNYNAAQNLQTAQADTALKQGQQQLGYDATGKSWKYGANGIADKTTAAGQSAAALDNDAAQRGAYFSSGYQQNRGIMNSQLGQQLQSLTTANQNTHSTAAQNQASYASQTNSQEAQAKLAAIQAYNQKNKTNLTVPK